jgi:hypothetical protein
LKFSKEQTPSEENAPMKKKMGTISRTATLRHWVRQAYYPCPNEQLQQIIKSRDQQFLNLVRDTVFNQPTSPYLKLLRHIGCEFNDFQDMVKNDGLEGALHRLAEAGVWVSHDEMKGREPVCRGSAVFYFNDSDFDNPIILPQFFNATSGSSGPRTRVGISLKHYEEQLLHTSLSSVFNNISNAETGLWLPPSEWAFSRLLRFARLGFVPARWFSQVPLLPPITPIKSLIRLLGFKAVLYACQVSVPWPALVESTKPSPVVDWLVSVLRIGRCAVLVTYPSAAVRLCLWSENKGMSLKGTVLIVAGEPISRVARETIEKSGAVCLPLFGTTESGESAEACLCPISSDDMHIYLHKFALIGKNLNFSAENGEKALLFTSLGVASPKIFLNAETGDAGIIEERTCECPWGDLGYNTHVRNVWSYAKLTTEGMTLPGTSIFRILEEDMPTILGGRPGDYQLILEQDDAGLNNYLLAINPSVGFLDPNITREIFLKALVSGKASSKLAADFLRRAGQLNVVRRPPIVQSGGKSLPVMFHRKRK